MLSLAQREWKHSIVLGLGASLFVSLCSGAVTFTNFSPVFFFSPHLGETNISLVFPFLCGGEVPAQLGSVSLKGRPC